MANQAYLNFLKDPDQETRRRELAAFIGPNSAKFLPVYDRIHAAANRTPGEKTKFSLFGNGFNPAAFFTGPVWFFYRKMWAWAWGIVALEFVLGLLPFTSRVGLPLGIGLAVGANQLYLVHAIASIERLRASNPDVSLEQLAAAGGVSKRAGWIAGVILVILSALGIWAIVTARGSGLQP